MQWYYVGLLLWLAAAGFYFYTSPSFQTIAYIASGRALGLPPTAPVGSLNATWQVSKPPSQSNADPRIVRWVYVKLPAEISKGKSVELRVTLAPKRRKRSDEETPAKIFLDFNADEQEPEVKIQLLAPNFNVDPPSREIALKLLKNKEVYAPFRISPREDTSAGRTEIGIQAFYKTILVGEFTKKTVVKDHVVDHLSARQAKTITVSMGVVGFVITYFGGLQQALEVLWMWLTSL